MLVDCGCRAAGQAGSAETGPRREGSGGCGALRLQCCNRAPGGSGGAVGVRVLCGPLWEGRWEEGKRRAV